ncbi:MAG: hypothetical protein WKF37_06685 [Bryobacteraceae bacterium]
MPRFLTLLLLLTVTLTAAPEWAFLRTVDGKQFEGQIRTKAVRVVADGKPLELPLGQILSLHSGAAASPFEAAKIKEGIAAIVGADRRSRDLAVEELTAIGIPVMTPLLTSLKDTDQHEPRPLYRLFERIMPSYADGFDRDLSLVRMATGPARRVQISEGNLSLLASDGTKVDMPWSKVRSLAVRRKQVQRSAEVHSIRHCLQIDYLDTGIVLTKTSKLNTDARGFVRLSWDADGWASDANGLTKPGSDAYKTNLVNGHPFGALVGRTGAAGNVFFLGKHADKALSEPGRLNLAINDNGHWQNNLGTFRVSLTATDAYDMGDAQ